VRRVLVAGAKSHADEKPRLRPEAQERMQSLDPRISVSGSLLEIAEDFNDAGRDKFLWYKLSVGSGNDAYEYNDRLWTKPGGTDNSIGFASDSSYQTENYLFQVNCQNYYTRETQLALMATSVTTQPWDEANGYRIVLYDDNAGNDDRLWVQKRVAGSPTTLYNGARSSNTNKLTIKRIGGKIYFLEGDTQRVSETYSLAADELYIYLFSRHPLATGSDWFDDFTLRKWIEPGPTHGSWLAEERQSTGFRITGCNVLGCSIR